MTTSAVSIAVNDLTGPALDWATASALGLGDETLKFMEENYPFSEDAYFSSDWYRCSPMITEYQIMLCPESHIGNEGGESSELWYANVYYDGGEEYTTNMCETPLIAACRAIVGMRFGDAVEIPAGLLGGYSDA